MTWGSWHRGRRRHDISVRSPDCSCLSAFRAMGFKGFGRRSTSRWPSFSCLR